MRSTVLRVFGGLAALMVASTSILARQPAAQNFSVVASPSTATVTAGGPAVEYTLVLTSQGYTGRVSLSCDSGAPGVSCSAWPNSVEINPTLFAAATVTARAAIGVGTGSYTLVIRADGDGSDPIEHSATVNLEVMSKVP
jgi:hypothetical protein